MTLDDETATLREIWIKDMVGAHRDCTVRWRVDFAKMEIELHVGFIVPSVLVSFLEVLPRYDERFLKTNITGAVRICERFKVAVWVAHGNDKEVRYRLKVYQPEVEIGGHTVPETELTAWENDRDGLT